MKAAPTSLAEVYRESAERFGDKPAFASRNGEKSFTAITFRELYDSGVHLATALIELGVNARDHVAILADNRQEWIMADYGTLLCGAVDVPRGTDVTDGDIQYILPHSDAKVVFVENAATLEKVERNRGHLPGIRKIILMDAEGVVLSDHVLSMKDLIVKGRKLRAAGDRRVEDRIAGIKSSDLFTIIYTSGTTGAPKGVMLTHANMLSQLADIPIQIGPGDRFLSILPIWHSFERVFEMGTIARGAAQYYSNVRNLRDDMRIVQPTFMASAPRLWESVHQSIQTRIQSGPGISRMLFRAAYFCAQRVQRGLRFLRGNELDLHGRNPFVSLCVGLGHVLSIVLFLLPHLILDRLVLRKIRAATGGKLRGTVSGGGALPFHVDEFFNTIGIPVLEGYGLTETSPGLAFRTPDRLVLGSVGPMFPRVELRLVDLDSGKIIYPPEKGVKGEVHVRGPQVMKGYYKEPELTRRVLTADGWLNTGDLGIVTFNNTLKLVGRSKETVVLLNGENVEPVPIESRIMQSPFVDHVMIVGQDQNFLGALVVPVLEKFKEHGSTHADLARNEIVRRAILKEVKASVSAQNGFKSFEKVSDIRLLPKTFEVGDELSAKMSMKRHVIAAKYRALIESMYV